jgi:hypothetical protein
VLRRQQRSGEVDVEDLLPRGEVGVQQRSHDRVRCGVDDDDVRGEAAAVELREQGGDLGGHALVADDGQDVGAGLAELGRGGVEVGGLAAGDGDGGAAGGESLGDGQADAARGAGDKGLAATQVERVCTCHDALFQTNPVVFAVKADYANKSKAPGMRLDPPKTPAPGRTVC